MNKVALLRATGIITFLFVLGHFTFPLMPGWEETLTTMNEEMRNIFLTYHYGIIAFLAVSAFILTFQPKKLAECAIKNAIMLLFASLYIVRIITEFVLWKAPMPQALIILPLCIFPTVVFLFVILKK